MNNTKLLTQLRTLLLIKRKLVHPSIPKEIQNINMIELIIADLGLDQALVFGIKTLKLDWITYITSRGAAIPFEDSDIFKWLVEEGHLNIIQYLLQYLEEHNIKIDYDSILVLSSKSGRLDLVKYSVEQGANIESFDKSWNSNFVLLYKNGSSEMMTYLLSYASYDAYDNAALKWSAKEGHLEVVKYLVEHRANVHSSREHALRWAAREGHFEVVKYLVEQGADIHSCDECAFKWSVEKGHLKVVQYLVEQGVDIFYTDVGRELSDFALEVSSKCGHLTIVKYLIEQGVDIHSYGYNALWWSARGGYLEVVKYLVEQGASINVCSDNALKVSVERGHLEVVKYLVEQGADINKLSDDIIKKGNKDMIELLNIYK